MKIPRTISSSEFQWVRDTEEDFIYQLKNNEFDDSWLCIVKNPNTKRRITIITVDKFLPSQIIKDIQITPIFSKLQEDYPNGVIGFIRQENAFVGTVKGKKTFENKYRLYGFYLKELTVKQFKDILRFIGRSESDSGLSEFE